MEATKCQPNTSAMAVITAMPALAGRRCPCEQIQSAAEGNDQSRQVHFVTVWQHQRLDEILPHSLPNATTEPVNVTAR